MRMPSARLAAVVAVVMVAVGPSSGAALAMQAQPQAPPAAPGRQGGTIGGGRSGPNVPRQPQMQRPVRDPRQPPAEGTATIRGRVVDAATGAAISRAKVRISGRDPRSVRVATTDAEGAFTLTKVPPGSLMLSAEKATYLYASYPDRQRTMRGTGLTISDGQTIDNITIPMHRGGAITGRVLDAYGDPAENVMVQVIPVLQNDRGMSLNRGGMRGFQGSNDIGEFRIGRLGPGQYYLLASPQRNRGNAEDGSSAIGRTFYPGVPSIEQAQPITVERGQSVAGVDFQLLETTLTRVTGFVTNAKGAPARRGHVSSRSAGGKGIPRGWAVSVPDGGSGLDNNGSFELMLQPGEYIIEAQAASDDVPSMNSFEMDRGQVRLVVAGEAIANVTIATGPGGTVSGRFVFNGRSAPPTSFAGFNIGFTGPNGGMGADECRAFARPTVNPDGTFTAENLWGTCQVRGGGMANGWTFEAVMHSGNDITNRAIEFGAGRSVSGIEIIYSDRVGELSMSVSNDRGTPAEDYVAIVFPVEKEKWGDQRFLRTQVMSPRTNLPPNAAPNYTNTGVSTNQFDPTPVVTANVFAGGAVPSNLRNLLAGDYFAVALEDAAPEDLRDPEYLERLSQMATRVTVSSGAPQSVQLRRVKAPN